MGPKLYVNTNEDHDDGFCDTFINGLSDCTLREAINASNGDIVANEITFADNYTITLDGSQLPAVTS
ncbi:MAG: CSLREA domain-containing protein [Anaerolineales bacterium]|nr:CSLREA domain-containing protein [Anaerolineales bacterium]